MKLFLDNNLPPRLARGLHTLFEHEHVVTCHRDKFGNTHIADEDWMRALGAEGSWIILSGDLNIARKKPSRDLFLRLGLVGFFPRKAVMELPLPRKAARILELWEAMDRLSNTVQSGCFELPQRSTRFAQLA